MMTTTDTQTVELDEDLRQTVSRLAAVQEQKQTLEAEEKRLKEIVRKTLVAGQRGTVDGNVVVTLSPNRRFQAALAAEILPGPLLELCQVVTVDSKKAKATLPPAMYEACMAEVGEPVVKIA